MSIRIKKRKDFWAVTRKGRVFSRHHLKRNAEDMAKKLKGYNKKR